MTWASQMTDLLRYARPLATALLRLVFAASVDRRV
jgi:hypothetical protein